MMEEKQSAHVALPLKYRPMTFDDVVGQDHVTRTLRNALKMGRIANAYLFVGPRGIGKTTLSRIFAKALNCPSPNGVEPCGECETCRQIAEGRSLDVLEFDAASHRRVEDVEPIMASVQFRPASSKYKIFIVDECHMLTDTAWNALLKTLEEPPPYVKFIFATTEGDKVLATIVSRCQRFDLRRIQTHQIADRLRSICEREGINAAEDALLAIARGAEGGMRDALSSLDQLIAFKGSEISEEDALSVFGLVSRQALETLAGAILKGDAATILSSIEAFDSAGKNMRRLAAELMHHFRNLVVYQTLGASAAGLEATPEQTKTLAEQAKLCDMQRLFRVADVLSDMEDKMRSVLSVRTFMEMTLLRASRVATVATIEELLRAVRTLRGPIVPLAAAPVASAAPQPSASAAASAPKAPAAAAQKPASGEQPQAAAAAKPEPRRRELSKEELQQVMDDPRLNQVMGVFPGSKVMEVK